MGKDLLDSNLQSVLPTPSPGGTESQDEGKPGARCGTSVKHHARRWFGAIQTGNW